MDGLDLGDRGLVVVRVVIKLDLDVLALKLDLVELGDELLCRDLDLLDALKLGERLDGAPMAEDLEVDLLKAQERFAL